MSILSWLFGEAAPVGGKSVRARLGVETLGERTMPSVGLAYVGLSRAQPAEMSYLAGRLKTQPGESEVSFLPFEFNPTNPFGNATKLAKETLPGMVGRLRLTVDLEWFVHSSGRNGKLNDGGSAFVHGRQAQQAFWDAWAADRPTAPQRQIRAAFLDRVHQADVWVNQLRTWAAGQGVGNKLGVTYVPVLEDEFPTVKGYTNLVNGIKAQQAADGTAPTQLRRSPNGSNSASFRISGVSLELHGNWSSVKNRLQSGDTWSNDGTVYKINNFVADGKAAKRAGVSALYWNTDMNGTPKTDTNWTKRSINVFLGPPASDNKARLTLVFTI